MNYYDILEVQPSASEEVIKMAYKALVKKYHPDNYIGDPKEAEKIMRQINEAYDILSDREKRAQYDATHNFNQSDNLKSDSTFQTTSYKSNKAANEKPTTYSTQNLHPKIKRRFFGKIYSIFKTISVIVIIYVAAGLFTGNLTAWNKEIIYYGSYAYHLIQNFSLPHNYEKDSAEYIIAKYIDALFSGDQYAAESYIDTSNTDTIDFTYAISDLFRLSKTSDEIYYFFKDMGHADININHQEDDRYIVTFRTYDYQLIYDKAEIELYYETNVDTALKKVKQMLYVSPKNLKYDIAFEVEEKNGSYIITSYEYRKLVYAMTGNLADSVLDWDRTDL